MTSVAVFVPVLNRPHRVAPLIESLFATAPDADPIFIVSPGDTAEKNAVLDAGVRPLYVDWHPGRADYAKKMNYAWRHTDHDFVLLGADDLLFRPGWLQAALTCHKRTRACVVGTNDLGNARTAQGHHSTHTLVSRRYGECGTIDDQTVLLHEGYWHNFVDDEFVQTAMWRETWAHAADAVIEHLHPNWGKADDDATYQRAQERFGDDRRLYQSRAHLWGAGRRTRRARVHAGGRTR